MNERKEKWRNKLEIFMQIYIIKENKTNLFLKHSKNINFILSIILSINVQIWNLQM